MKAIMYIFTISWEMLSLQDHKDFVSCNVDLSAETVQWNRCVQFKKSLWTGITMFLFWYKAEGFINILKSNDRVSELLHKLFKEDTCGGTIFGEIQVYSTNIIITIFSWQWMLTSQNKNSTGRRLQIWFFCSCGSVIEFFTITRLTMFALLPTLFSHIF